MCLYPKTIENPKYKPNDKNKGNIPRMLDPRLKYIEIPCGKCYQCRKQKGRDWAIGMSYRDWETDRKSTRLNSSHSAKSRMPSSA